MRRLLKGLKAGTSDRVYRFLYTKRTTRVEKSITNNRILYYTVKCGGSFLHFFMLWYFTFLIEKENRRKWWKQQYNRKYIQEQEERSCGKSKAPSRQVQMTWNMDFSIFKPALLNLAKVFHQATALLQKTIYHNEVKLWFFLSVGTVKWLKFDIIRYILFYLYFKYYLLMGLRPIKETRLDFGIPFRFL